MRIAFYAPFKPLDHTQPSGDLMIGRSLHDHLIRQGHTIQVISRLRARWIYWKPWLLTRAIIESVRIRRQLRRDPVDLWLTYHCYYKAPDILGPAVCRAAQIPYVIVQGSYATKWKRKWQTRPGFLLNRHALQAADFHISNRFHDWHNITRLIPAEKVVRLRPGLYPHCFPRSATARREIRKQWQAADRPVILTAAMFRSDVKSMGIAWVIESCLRLDKQGYDFLLVIAGDGRERKRLEQLAQRLPTWKVLFTGQLSREKMYRFYSAGDVFVFPGFRESLGMVYLEAQACGLPVVACEDGGIPEVVLQGKTGILTPLHDTAAFDRAIIDLIDNVEKREKMGRQAANHVRTHHDLERNYRQLGSLLEQVRQRYQQKKGHGDGSDTV